MVSPTGVMRPILFAESSVNQRFPSGPDVIPLDARAASGNSVITPSGVTLPIANTP